MVARTALVAALAGSAAAHMGCDSYTHGKDLFKRDPAMAEQEAILQKRYPNVNARVLLGDHEALERRAGTTTYPATLTRVNSRVVAGLSSGTGTSLATEAIPSSPVAGEASPLKGAQPLPAVTINPAEWPTLDRPPPVDSTQVKQWISQIDFAGIPNIPVNGINGCANSTNAQAVTDAAKNGWWTCGGVTRNTDVTYCPNKNTWGVSYDDGPAPYTPMLLNYMDAADIKSTFFVVGSRVISRPDILQYEYMAGHQLAVHTWSHFPLTTLTNEQIVAEFGWSKKAIYDVTGVTPVYMRPPYGDIDDRVRFIAEQMGLTPIIWTRYNGGTFDTRDWQIAGGAVNVSTVVSNFDSILSNAPNMDTGFIVLAHDLYQQSTELAVNYVLPKALGNPDLSLQTIIQCLGHDATEAYVETRQNETTAAVPTTPIVGASDSGLVQGLTVTPVAHNGDYTGPGSTLGQTAAPSVANQASNSDSSDSSSASSIAASVGLLFATAVGMFVLA